MRFMDSGPDAGGFGNESDDDAIPIIPDLDDVRDEDMQLQVNSETKNIMLLNIILFLKLQNLNRHFLTI